MKVGIIGLGLMGMAFSKHLVKKGYEVLGYDVNPEKRAALEALGGRFCESCAQVGAQADAVLLLVFNGEQVRGAVCGEQSLLSTMPAGKAVLVMCSVGCDAVDAIRPALAKRDIHLLDATMMGNCEDAENGCVHIMVAADDAAFAPVEGLLRDMSAELYFISKTPGDAQKAKSCLQALFSLTFETAFEVVALAQNAGLDMNEMHRVFANSPSSSPLLHITEKCVLDKVYTGTNNPLSILDKDINLVLELAAKEELRLGACEGTAKVFDKAMRLYPGEDIFAAVKALRASDGTAR
ncbi:MAG: NAD(P)-dependent oxidoreductase [Clostridia bacterium]|nr:NAD(P)-dependent oxidoreductase [Clostridia bacterium]